MWARRAFLKAAGGGLVAGLLPRGAEALEKADLVLASAIQLPGGAYGAALVSERGAVIASLALPDRGHDITISPDGRTGVVFARQPGTFAVVFDIGGKGPARTLASPEGRHFFGHGAFSHDGRLLYATENDFDAARGVIGIYDVTGDYRRIGEFDTGGIGPHEMLLSADGTCLVVANGGIETHPDFGRAELNIDTMDPSIAFIDTASGALIGQVRLAAELHQLSIRHMAFDAAGRVWFGCQFRGASAARPQLVGVATRNGDIRLMELPEAELGGLRNYVGSVGASRDGALIGVASPEGDSVLVLAAESERVVASRTFANACGVAAGRDGLVVSSGDGVLAGVAGAAGSAEFGFGFDNHLRLVRAG